MCEETIIGILHGCCGFERIPAPTEAMTLLIEGNAAERDLAMNLSDESYECSVTRSLSAARSRKQQPFADVSADAR